MITLRPPAPTDAQLRAIAASGAKGMVTAAREELQRRTTERLRRELGR